MNKYGEVTTDSKSDFDPKAKAEFYDAKGFAVADKKNVDKLKQPVKITNAPNTNK